MQQIFNFFLKQAARADKEIVFTLQSRTERRYGLVAV